MNDNFLSSVNYEKLKQIMGSDLKGLYVYYCDNFYKFKENTCTVLYGDKHKVLASWFFDFIQQNLGKAIDENFEFTYINGNFAIRNKNTNAHNIIVSEKQLYLDAKIPADYKFSILDDICVHESGIMSLKDFISKQYSHDGKAPVVETCAYYYSPLYCAEKLDKSYIESDDIWTCLNLQLINMSNFLNLPSTSMLNSYSSKMTPELFNSIYNLLKLDQNLVLENTSTQKELNFGKKSFLVAEKMCSMEDKELVKFSVISYNQNTNTFNMTPYVLLDSLKSTEINEVVGTYLNDSAKHTFALTDDKLALHEVITAIASNRYGRYFMQQYLPMIELDEASINTINFAYDLLAYDAIVNPENHKPYNKAQHVMNKIDLSDKHEAQADVNEVLGSHWLEREKDSCYIFDLSADLQHAKGSSIKDIIFDTDKFGKKELNWAKLVALIKAVDKQQAILYSTKTNNGEQVEFYVAPDDMSYQCVPEQNKLSGKDAANRRQLAKANNQHDSAPYFGLIDYNK